MGLRSLGLRAVLCWLYVSTRASYADGRAIRSYAFPDPGQAKFANELSEYEVSIPFRVDHQGALVSNQLRHTLSHSHVRKRSTVFTNTEHQVHYKLNIGGKDLTIKLRPNPHILSPGLVVERRHRKFGNISDSKISRWNKDFCHFVGHIKDQPQSFVAMATCNGLTGLLRTNENEYFIEPVKGHDLTQDSNHPHLVYKRSATSQSQHQPPQQNVRQQKSSETLGCGVRSGDIWDMNASR